MIIRPSWSCPQMFANVSSVHGGVAAIFPRKLFSRKEPQRKRNFNSDTHTHTEAIGADEKADVFHVAGLTLISRGSLGEENPVPLNICVCSAKMNFRAPNHFWKEHRPRVFDAQKERRRRAGRRRDSFLSPRYSWRSPREGRWAAQPRSPKTPITSLKSRQKFKASYKKWYEHPSSWSGSKEN